MQVIVYPFHLVSLFCLPGSILERSLDLDPPLPKDVIIALIDPDQMFLRTITPDIKGNPNNIISGKWKQEEIFDRVVKGRPVGQTYGLGAPWTNDNHKKFNRKKICGGRCLYFVLIFIFIS